MIENQEQADKNMTQQAPTRETKSQPGTEQVLLLSVKDISVDHQWNARSGRWWEDAEITPPVPPPENGAPAPAKKKGKEKVSERGDFAAFKASILESGTNTEPVICRQPAKAGGKPRLVSGFRRVKAITELADSADYKGPSQAEKGLVRVIVRELTEQQARLENVTENTARDDLSGPDLCWAVGTLVREHALSDSAIAARLGKSQPYISKLHRIGDALAPKVLEMWRGSPVRVTIDDIEREVIMITKDSDSRPNAKEQEDYFQRVVEGKGGKQASSRGPDAWIETKQKEAQHLGELLGQLQAEGIIEVKEKDPKVVVFTIVELPKRYNELNPAKKAKVERAILASFNAGVEAGMAAEDEDEEDEDSDDEEDDDQD